MDHFHDMDTPVAPQAARKFSCVHTPNINLEREISMKKRLLQLDHEPNRYYGRKWLFDPSPNWLFNKDPYNGLIY